MEFFFIIAGALLLVETIAYYVTGRDSTDAPGKRISIFNSTSNLRVYVDHATGVHYVKSSMFDKLQVRINADGTPYTGE